MNPKAGGTSSRNRIPFLIIVLGFVVVLFIAILAYTYVETRRANPTILDEHGTPR